MNQEVGFSFTSIGGLLFAACLRLRFADIHNLRRNTRIDQALGAIEIKSVSIENLIISIFLEIIGLCVDLLFDIQIRHQTGSCRTVVRKLLLGIYLV